ncbi:MAG: aminotransferase class I/II-fold pyridoxal phosphate-dependent enzyme [Actinomycetota bacterium]|nr:aminotransferase class I/II-fold pyridoxal phosphate-dependent enzyme [Actinomycetota bacterium]
MELSPFVDRIGGEGADGWAIHFEARQAQSRGEDIVVLSVGDPDFATPAGIIDRAVEAMADGDTHYTEIVGRLELREAIATHLGRHGIPADAANVMPFAGTQNALFASCMCLFAVGDEVIVPDPAYLTYEATIRASGAELVRVAPTPGFRPDVEAMERAVTEATKAIVITTPANPTGVVMTPAELEAIAAIACEHDLWVIADEVYADLVFDGSHCSIASLDEMAERTVVIGSLSKSHAMTGWRVGWAVAPPILMPHFANLGLAMLYGLPGFVQEAAITALNDHGDDVADMCEIYRRRRDLAIESLAAARDLPVLTPDAGMFVVADVRAHNSDSTQWAWDLYRATGVSVLDAGAFGSSSKGWVRISFTIGDDDLVEGCRRIAEFTQRPS